MTTQILRLGLVAGLLAVPSTVAAQAMLLDGLGGPRGYGVNDLPANDDGSTDEIDITSAFPNGLEFFGTRYRSLYLNNNGNVSFGNRISSFTPRSFPIASQPMIAPWWGDVDTRGGGFPARNGVWWHISPGRFVGTWHNVGYFSSHDDLQNDFQLILTEAATAPGDFDVEFRYRRCEWTTGDASGGTNGFGGTPAQAGFDAGNLTDFVALPGSLSMAVLDLCRTSNVGITGVWRFEIRSGLVMCPGRGEMCDTGLLGICAEGERVCISPDASECRQNEMARDDECNGLDDDCDGLTDESLGTSTCGVGECVNTVPNCVGGATQECTPLPPRMEVCNGLDDDCNGTPDDAPEIVCGIGMCERTVPGCVAGGPGVCVPGEPSFEVCNGLDDDCDGVVDDGLPGCVFDAGVPDAGPPPIDGGTTAEDAGDPFRLSGRAGPIGRCTCRAVGGASDGGPALGLGLLLMLGLALRRRRH